MKQRFFAAFAITIIWHVLDLIFRSLFLTQHNDVGLINDISPLLLMVGRLLVRLYLLYCIADSFQINHCQRQLS